MRLTTLFTIVCLAGAAHTASAQSGPVPNTGMAAVGVSAGGTVTTAPYLDNGPILSANAEWYTTPRVSIRGQLTGAWTGIVGQPDNQVRPAAFLGNVVYNWERGAWHPYATGGVGVYRFRATEFGLDSHDTKFGVNLGGGIEYFLTRRDTLTGELLVHAIPGNFNTLRTEFESTYWTIAGGYKKYF